MKFLTIMLAAVMTVGLTLPAYGASEDEKCIFKSKLLAGKYSACIAKADALVAKGRAPDTVAADAKCALKYTVGSIKNRIKAAEKGAGQPCTDATTDEKMQEAQVAVLLAFDRDLAYIEGLGIGGVGESGSIQSLIDESVAAVLLPYNCTVGAMCSYFASEYSGVSGYTNNYVGHVAGVGDAAGCDVTTWNSVGSVYDWALDDFWDHWRLLLAETIHYPICNALAGVDITTDNAAVAQTACEDAGGTWASESCTPGSSYNCTIAAMCSYWAAEDPWALPWYTNNYVGDMPDVGPAVGCGTTEWTTTQGLTAEYLPAVHGIPAQGGVVWPGALCTLVQVSN